MIPSNAELEKKDLALQALHKRKYGYGTWVEYWDDERNIDNGIIVTLRYGWSFESDCHEGVRGFDTVTEALEAVKRKHIYPCQCEECVKYGKK